MIGEDPGTTGWDEAQNQTLVRRPEVTGGDTQAVDEFNVLAVWDPSARTSSITSGFTSVTASFPWRRPVLLS